MRIILWIPVSLGLLLENLPINLNHQSNVNDSPVLMRRASVADARYYANVAGAAFCRAPAVQAFTCQPYCSATVNGTPSTPPTRQVRVHQTVYHTLADVKGYVAAIPDRNEIVVAMATGVVQSNRLFVTTALLTPLDIRHPLNNNTNIQPTKVLVHAPLLAIARSLFQQYRATLIAALKTHRTVMFTGHSIGAELTFLSAIIAHQELNIPWHRIRYLGYGMTRVGTQEFAKWINQQPLEATHVVNQNDKIVNSLSKSNNYQHFANEIFITKDNQIRTCDNRYFEDPECSITELLTLPTTQDPHLRAFQTNFGLPC